MAKANKCTVFILLALFSVLPATLHAVDLELTETKWAELGRSADENLPVVEFARTPLSSRPRRDSGESHYDPGKNSTAVRLKGEEAPQRAGRPVPRGW